MSSLPAGWYKDPADPVTQRYWDGEGWLGNAIPADAVPPDGPPALDEPEPPVAPELPPVVASPGMPPPGYQVQPPPGWVPPPGFPYPMGFPVQARPHGFALAGLGQRLMARIIDILAVLALNVVVNGYFAYQFWQEAKPIIQAAMNDPFGDTPTADGRMDTLVWIMLIVATLLWLLYEAPSTGSRGQTLGKRMMQIKVVKLADTTPLGFPLAFRRWARLGLWTPFWGCLGLGALFQFIDSVSPLFDQQLRQALHDKMARTVVVALPPHYRPTADATSGGGTSGSGTSGGHRDSTGGRS